jgi:competence ComEA-like helix-hairpin-helix protein
MFAGAILGCYVFSRYGIRWTGKGDQAAGQGRLNINTATAEEFQLWPRVGDSTAKNIIDYRKAHGPFKTVDGLEKSGHRQEEARITGPLHQDGGKSDFEPRKQKSAEERNRHPDKLHPEAHLLEYKSAPLRMKS